MTGSIPPLIAAEAILIMAGRAAVSLVSLLVVAALWWMASRADEIIARFFPLLEWEKDLGWLNLRAERRARTALRWLGYAIYLFLALTLLGIPLAVKSIVDEPTAWPDMPDVLGLLYHLGILFVCATTWVTFIAGWLIPKIRSEREAATLRKFRAQAAEEEREREHRRPRHPTPLISQYQKPRANSMEEVLSGRPNRLRPPPGE